MCLIELKCKGTLNALYATLNDNLLFKQHLISPKSYSFYSNQSKITDNIRQIVRPKLTYVCVRMVVDAKELFISYPNIS